ncbi:hypothetical protein Malapachy_2333 [Malassezia pachydermatis]|uniref:Pericentrin/AKAP-450 centrosomal targeting domain-containing protein n=1 Tax=Malassezia pachydermatis TaxID=77020 RepID=A0A0M8MVK9_9BASI|nr:hypothetical protein Malapachy_2333 [Malassezia pachydermatis]KOS15204.1 hypothetical protein Malapachy_2333 [Malassezia pachydermatis]
MKTSEPASQSPLPHETSAVDLHALDERLLDDSDSLQISFQRSHASDLSSVLTGEASDLSDDAQFMAEEPPTSLSSNHSTSLDAIPDSPSTSRARSVSPSSVKNDMSTHTSREGSRILSPIPSNTKKDGTVSSQTSIASSSIASYGLARPSSSHDMAGTPATSHMSPEMDKDTLAQAGATLPPPTPPTQSHPTSDPYVSATTPLHPPVPGRTAFHAAMTHDTRSVDFTNEGLSALSTHAELSHGAPTTWSRILANAPEPDTSPASKTNDVSIAPLLASASSEQSGEKDFVAPHAHVDPHRLVMYQHKINERLTRENELLKAECDALIQLLQKHQVPLDGSDEASPASSAQTAEMETLRRRNAELEAMVQSQPQALEARKASVSHDATALQHTTDTLQDQHDQILTHVEATMTQPTEEELRGCIEQLTSALQEAHGLINTLREQPSLSSSVSTASASVSTSRPIPIDASSWRHSTPSRVPAMDALRRSVAALSVTDDAGLVMSDLGALQETVRTLTHDLQATQAKLQEALAYTTEANASKLRIEARLATTADELADAEARLHDRSQQLQMLREQRSDTTLTKVTMARLESALQEAQREVSTARAQHEQAEHQQAILAEQLQRAETRFVQAQQAADEAREARVVCEAHMDDQLTQLQSLRRVLADQNAELGQLRGEKDHLWIERRQILEQLRVFEQHLRDVRAETDRYGSELHALQREKAQWSRERSSSPAQEQMVREHVAQAIRALAPRWQAERERVQALLFQKAYLVHALDAQEWLYERLCTRLHAWAPALDSFRGRAYPRPTPRRWRVALAAVHFAVRLQKARERMYST